MDPRVVKQILLPPIEFTCQKLAGKVGDGSHMTLRCCNCQKYTPLARGPNHDHVTVWILREVRVRDSARVVNVKLVLTPFFQDPGNFKQSLSEQS